MHFVINRSNTEMEGDKLILVYTTGCTCSLDRGCEVLIEAPCDEVRKVRTYSSTHFNLGTGLGKRSASSCTTERPAVHAQFWSRVLFESDNSKNKEIIGNIYI
jgi:hypothetical protein